MDINLDNNSDFQTNDPNNASANTNDVTIPQPLTDSPKPNQEDKQSGNESSHLNKELDDLTYEDFTKLDIFEVLGMTNASSEQKKEVEDKMLDSVRARALDRVDQELSLEAQAEWKDIVDSDKEDDLEDFFKRNNINLSNIMIEEAVKYKMELLQLSKDNQKTEI